MSKLFDPRKVLLHLSKTLLREFFASYPAFEALPWDKLAEGEIDGIHEAWMTLPAPQRRDAQMILQDINELADSAGLAFLADQIGLQCQERMPQYAAIQSRADKALWAYLNLPKAFQEASLFARTKSLSSGRYWEKRNGLPHLPLVATDELKRALGERLVAYYSKAQGRGFRYHVQHYTWTGASEYFYVYMDDYPDNRPAFDDAGLFRRRPGQNAFDNVFVYCAADGTLELYAQGGRELHDALQKEFCGAVLGIDVEPAGPTKPVYQLDGLKNVSFAFHTDYADRIADVRIRSLRIEPIDASRRSLTIKADPKGPQDDIHRVIDLYLSATHLPRAKMRVTMATLQLTFMSDGATKAKTMSFDISHPSSCNLKSKPDDMRAIGERCLKKWGIAS